jgi:anti-anti-sigma factor
VAHSSHASPFDPRFGPRNRRLRHGPADPRLTLRTLPVNDDVVVVTAAGEIDLANGAMFAEVLTAAAAPGPRLLACDLTGVGFLACTGITTLVELRADLAARGGLLRVVTTDSTVLRVLEATGELTNLGVCGDLTAALAGFGTPPAALAAPPAPLAALRTVLDQAVEQTTTLAALCGDLADQVAAVDHEHLVDERGVPWRAGDTLADTAEDLRAMQNHLATSALLAAPAIEDLGHLRGPDSST